MKKLLFSLIATILVSSVSFSQDFDKILNDSDFEAYLIAYDKEVKLPKDYNKIKELMSDDKIDENEIKDIHEYLGYESYDAYISNLALQANLLEKLENRYTLSQYTQEELADLFDAGFTMYKMDTIGTIGMAGTNCGRRLRNCHGLALAVAVGAHIACGPADVTIIIGLMCHSAATGAHYLMLDNCNLDYQDCIRG
ncbi:hypothetical protein FLJC2902T_32320 [Flavobacterium limnosediminis JC2902]|uniref:Uncharacterized protein n=1 Tax=Flavobacterium limnosediminis JC2902 TaxID=1341181 RepID=V6S8Q0_9FLAO|nr:hypothetical protein [Flavobacterium limnosediminis]ESU23068.1 hypothetical protein FLJC2902T_32320 [Flavobacterium limnosediminis JC2902]